LSVSVSKSIFPTKRDSHVCVPSCRGGMLGPRSRRRTLFVRNHLALCQLSLISRYVRYQLTDKKRQVASEADIKLECGGDIVTSSVSVVVNCNRCLRWHLHNQIDTSDLVHELHAIGKENTSTSLHLVSLENLAPPV